MMKQLLASALAVALLTGGATATPALATKPAVKAADARIAFANHGGIQNWQADGDHAIWLQASGRRWYRAELLGPCNNLNFANAVGFETSPDGAFDRFSSVVVRGQRCPVKSFTASAPPPKKAKHHS
jgi:hypothetical protein